ncbi:MAG: hypothetical protein ACI9QQ_001096 [Myxococcota bacterium]|jgi:hypothetical protein
MIISMLMIIAAAIVVAAALLGAGASTHRILTGHTKVDLTTCFWTGFAVVVGSLQLIHFEFALNSPWVSPTLAGVGLLGLVWNRAALVDAMRIARPEHWSLSVGLVLFALWLANRGLAPLRSIDSGLYHLTSIKWASEAPLALGLGNLHGRLAFNNASFLWLSALDQWPSVMRGFNFGASLLLYAAILTVTSRFRGKTTDAHPVGLSRIFYVLMSMPLLYAASVMHVSSTGPDWIVLIIGVVLAVELASAQSDVSDAEKRSRFLAVAALATVGVTVKLSFAAIGLGALAIAGLQTFDLQQRSLGPWLRHLAPGLGLAICLLAPWSIRSIALSGYPAYPSTALAAPVSWKVPAERANAELDWIVSWARAPGQSPEAVLGNNEWLAPWLRNRLRNGDSIALFVAPLALLIVAGFAAANRRRRPSATELGVALPFALGVIVWFAAAPDPRFLGGALWALSASLLSSQFPRDELQAAHRFGQRCILALVGLVVLTYLGFVIYMGGATGGAFIRPGPIQGRYPVKKIATNSFATQHGLTLNVPARGDQCWEAELPCTPYPAPRLRRQDGDRGFELQ